MTSEIKQNSIVIRSFQPSDQAECRALFKLVHDDYGNPIALTKYVLQTDMANIPKAYLDVPDGHWWVAVSTDDNRIVGHLAVLPLKLGSGSYYAQAAPEERDHICELLRMVIDPSVERQGLGGRLLSTLIDFVRERGYRQIHLTTLKSMKKACAFYDKQGFVKGRIARFPMEELKADTEEEFKNLLSNLTKPTIFETDADLSDDDRQMINMPPNASKYFYSQHYLLVL